MSPRALSITEPHPSVSKQPTTFLTTGRGGAGNYKRYKTSTLTAGPSAEGPASRTNLFPTTSNSSAQNRANFTSAGRGGSGNMFSARREAQGEGEGRVFQFDEEMARRTRVEAPVYHIGRGGAANWVDERDEAEKRRTSERRESEGSARSESSDASRVSSARRTFGGLVRRFS